MIKEKSICALKTTDVINDTTILWCDTIVRDGALYSIRILATREIKQQIYWRKIQTNFLSIFIPTMYDNPERLLIERIFRYNFIQTGE